VRYGEPAQPSVHQVGDSISLQDPEARKSSAQLTSEPDQAANWPTPPGLALPR
jgi:hypothetical protein